jgi:DNA-directed RNA polymerase subunit RPC12/RpoP
MGFLDRLFNKETVHVEGAPVFKTKDTRSDGTVYEIYESADTETAKKFLAGQKVTRNIHYIIVETPVGNWGADINGVYLEELLPWQKNISSFDCKGGFIPLSWNNLGLKHAAMGISDNFTLQLKCGKCSNQWLDGIRYQNETIVQCPQCKAKNKIDSKNISVALL